MKLTVHAVKQSYQCLLGENKINIRKNKENLSRIYNAMESSSRSGSSKGPKSLTPPDPLGTLYV